MRPWPHSTSRSLPIAVFHKRCTDRSLAAITSLASSETNRASRVSFFFYFVAKTRANRVCTARLRPRDLSARLPMAAINLARSRAPDSPPRTLPHWPAHFCPQSASRLWTARLLNWKRLTWQHEHCNTGSNLQLCNLDANSPCDCDCNSFSSGELVPGIALFIDRVWDLLFWVLYSMFY